MTAPARLVVLDAFTTNPGDLSWAPLASLGQLQLHDRTPPGLVAERISRADVVITNKTRLTADLIEAAPQLRGVAMLSTGFDVVDGDAARRRGLPFCNVPEYGTASVAQAVFALLLELTNHTGQLAAGVRAGRWSAAPDFCYWDATLTELAGLTLGIVGLGRIGLAVARIGAAFGMEILGHRRSSQPLPQGAAPIRLVDLDTLLAASDVVSLHCPLNQASRGLIHGQRLAAMKPTALLINTGRGALVEETDLDRALREGRLAGAGLDVLSVEPPAADHPLLSAPNCVITPHVAWATRQARQRLIDAVAANVAGILAGTPSNVVNGV